MGADRRYFNHWSVTLLLLLLLLVVIHSYRVHSRLSQP